MPEGDTVHRRAATLCAALAGRVLRRMALRRDPRGVRIPPPRTVVESVEAQGKHLLVRFADGATLHTHMRLDGVWHVYAPGRRRRRAGHRARVVLEVEPGTTAVCFDAPLVELRRDAAAGPASRAARSIARLGPDLSGADPDIDVVLDRLQALPAATELGVALLDQRVASGIGNVFKSEVCWACPVHPCTPLARVEIDLRRRLYETAHTQLRADVGRSRRVTHAGGLAVYRKVGRPCRRCRTPIRRTYDGADRRVTYCCPSCRPAAVA